MKKFLKFVLGTLSLATLACGAYYFIKKYVCKDSNNEFDDLDDNYEDYESEEEKTTSTDGREYVSINITSDNADSDIVTETVDETTPVSSEETVSDEETKKDTTVDAE